MRMRTLVLLIGLAAPSSAVVIGAGDPQSSSIIVTSTTTADGVALNGEVWIEFPNGSCSGSLLSDGTSILTAAHCVDPPVDADAPGSGLLGIVSSAAVTFNTGVGGCGIEINHSTLTTNYCYPPYIVTDVADFFVDPNYIATGGDYLDGDDLAVIQLSSPAPAGITGYSLFSGNETDAIGGDVEVAGAGESGVGVIDGSYPAGTMRQGQTQYTATCADTTITVDGCSTDNVLLAEFANTSQVEIAPGDSGGGSFYNGQLIGVHSFDNCTASNCPIVGDQSNSDNSLFGDTYVGGSNAAWIESVEAGIPEPATAALLAMGLAAGLLMRRWDSSRPSPPV